MATLEVNFKKGVRNDQEQWVLEMKNQKLMHQWVELVNDALLKEGVKPKVEEEEKMPNMVQSMMQPPMQTIVE